MATRTTDAGTTTARQPKLSKHDAHTLRLTEMGVICDTLAQLDAAEWDHDTYCTGWRVRDVVGHMLLGYTTPMGRMLRKIASTRFDVDKASAIESVAYGSAHTPEQLLAELRRVQRDDVRMGISKVIPPSEGVVDHLIHHMDITLPLGRTPSTGPAAMLAALDTIVTLGGFVRAKARAKDLRFRATDMDWSWGTGPEVNGSGRDLLLALSGRPVGLEGLSGDGLPLLRGRL